MFSIRLIAPWLLFPALPAFAGMKLPKPGRAAAPGTPEQAVPVHEGVALHDRHDYEPSAGSTRLLSST
jgi:hypothetical protein